MDRSADVLRELKPLDPNAKNPTDLWFDFFSKRKPNGRTVSEIVFQLHESKKHEHVIAVIEAALSHGYVYPWMYEVLALSYKIAGRPDEDVERALYSAVDPNVDFQSMMFSSAYLSRFDNKRPALRMYRQASTQNPFRPEPYILGLRLARDLEDVDAIEWAVIGVLNYGWTENTDKIHRDAMIAYEEALAILKKNGQEKRMSELKKNVEDALQRDLIVEMSWNGNSDVDLIVEEPIGSVCDFQNSHTIAGGVHVKDGYGPDECYEKYVCVRAFSGKYFLRINHIYGNVVAGRVNVVVTKHQGTDQESIKRYSITLKDETEDILVNLDDGRREKPNEALKKNQQSRLELWNPEVINSRTAKRGPKSLTTEQRDVLMQFLSGGVGTGSNGVAGGGIVGGAAIGFAPTITPIIEGTTAGVSAVVSDDRRYVRIGVNATFRTIVDVFNYSLSNGQSMRVNGN